MSRDGSGGYSRTQADYVYGTVIDETKINDELNDFATEIANSIDKDGQTVLTGNLDLNNAQKFIQMANGSARTDSLPLGQAQDGAFLQAGSVSGVDTITAALTPAITAYATGLKFWFIAAGANTGAVTINLNSVGALALKKQGGTALVAGDIPAAGAIVECAYDGTDLEYVNFTGLTDSSTHTLTNKTIDADGTGNALSNIDIANCIAASQAEAEAGADNTKILTPLRVAQAIAALGASAQFYAFDFSIDTSTATGTQAVTGFGFQPDLVLNMVGMESTTTRLSVDGYDDGTNRHCVFNNHGVSTDTWSQQALNTASIYSAQATGISYAGKVNSMDSDGITIGWTKTGAKTATLYVRGIALKF